MPDTKVLELKPRRLFAVGVASGGRVVVIDLAKWREQREARVGSEPKGAA